MPAPPELMNLTELSLAQGAFNHSQNKKISHQVFKSLLLLVMVLVTVLSIHPSLSFKKSMKNPFVSLRRPHPDFVGRKSYLSQLENLLISKPKKWNPTLLTRLAVIWGKGGYGKTELAIQFANQNLSKFSIVWAITCDTKGNLYQGFARLAEALDLFEANDSLQTLKRKVYHYLETHKFSRPYLLILDNVEGEDIDYPQRGGAVLMTSQKRIGRSNNRVFLGPFSQKEAVEVLMIANKSRGGIEELAESLDRIPLLVNNAAHYIQATPGCNYTDYAEMIASQNMQSKTFLWKATDINSRYLKTLSASWKAPFTQLEKKHPLAAKWLTICAYLNPENIPEEWLIHWVGRELSVERDEAVFVAKNLLGELLNYGLLTYDIEKKRFSIHRFFQEIMRTERADHLAQDLSRAISCVAMHARNYQYTNLETWDEGDQWFVHAKEVQHWLEDVKLPPSIDQASLYHGQGKLYGFYDRPEKALIAHQKAFKVRKKMDPQDAYEIATSYKHLAWAHFGIESLNEAFSYILKAEEWIHEKKYPVDRSTILNIKGLVLLRLERYQEALSVFSQSLELRQSLVGSAHIEVVRCFMYMCCALNGLKQYEKSITLSKKVIEMLQSLCGQNHPLYAFALEIQSHALIEVEQFDKALVNSGQALMIRSRVIPRVHGDLARGWFCMGRAFFHKEEGSLARYCFEKSLEISRHFPIKSLRYFVKAKIYLGKCDFKEGKIHSGTQHLLEVMKKCDERSHPELFKRGWNALLQASVDDQEALEEAAIMAKSLLGPDHLVNAK